MENTLALWLQNKSENTKKSYTKIVQDFLESFTIDVGTKEVDKWVATLTDSPNTVRLKVAALSSYFSKLHRWGYVNQNPFHGVELPKLDKTKKKSLSNTELDKLLTCITFAYENRSKEKNMARKTLIAIHLMTRLGLRVGSLKDLRVKDGRFYTSSKGRNITGEFNVDLEYLKSLYVNLNVELPFSNLNSKTIDRLLKKYGQESLGKNIHAHLFRHYFAQELLKETKDIYEVSRKLNHSSVLVTEHYLRGIEFENGEYV